MSKLIIKELGMTVNIPGIPEFKTPAHLDITNIDLTKLTTSLKNSGIRNFEITNDDITRTFRVFSKKELVNNSVQKIEIKKDLSKIDLINLINKRFDKLEELILNNYSSNKTSYNKQKIEKRLLLDDLENGDIFIQEIDTEKMKINRSNEIIIKDENENFEDDVNSLSKILGG